MLNSEKRVFETTWGGRPLSVEIGQMAKQANGSVLVRYGDTVVLTAAVASKQAKDVDFFPLTVNYDEKMYAVGKIPGGFIKREARPSENATLTARLIDRPIRPMFAEGFRNEVQITNVVMSVEQDCQPEMAAMLGSSLALCVSDIPFNGPIAGVDVGRVNGEYVINPTVEQLELSDIELTVAGTKDAINMVESGAKEVSEEDMLGALLFGHAEIKRLVAFQEEIAKEIGKEKMEITLLQVDADLEKEINETYQARMVEAIQTEEKLAREDNIDALKEEIKAFYEEKFEEDEESAKWMKEVRQILEDMEKNEVRRLITIDKVRPDGRKIDEIRPLASETGILPRVHGSGLFTRGQTQALTTCTLAPLGEHQIIDGLGTEESKRFIHHYNFPQFSVGETGRYGAPGRREIGHGALGERALAQVIPSEDVFPYTIRVVSEILESNGSSSQASICAGCMSLMAAGVPLKAPVAGIAMGLITSKDEKDYTILTDIQGMEDHLGDMDFKVGGTRKGICSLQMDIKIKGITKQILKEALAQAKEARMKILDMMEGIIAEPRKEVSKYAPKTEIFKINPDKIKDVIGKGGDMITKIILEASHVNSVNDVNAVKVDLADDGTVTIYHMDKDIIAKTREMIENVAREVEIGKIYTGKVVDIHDFGCFVRLWEGCEGLVHVSQLANERVEKPSDVVSVGDEILVKATGYDKKGKLNLSRKEALPKKEVKEEKKETKE